MPPRHQGLVQLHRFFEEAFTTDQLRTVLWKLPEGSTILGAVPDGPPSVFAREVADALRRFGLLDEAFFAALAEARPRHADGIIRIRRACESPDPDGAPPAAPPEPVRRALRVLIALEHHWKDGGFEARFHAGVAGTTAGALKSIQDRLEIFDQLEAAPHNPGDPGHFQRVRWEIRVLYGAVRRWYEIEGLPVPAELTG